MEAVAVCRRAANGAQGRRWVASATEAVGAARQAAAGVAFPAAWPKETLDSSECNIGLRRLSMLSMRMDIAVKAGGGEQTAVKPAAEMRKRYAVIVGMREWSDKDAADAAHAKAFVDATPKLVKALKAASAASSGVASEDPLVALVAPGSAGATPPAWAAAAREAGAAVWCDANGAWTRALGMELPNGGRRYAATLEDGVLLQIGLHHDEAPNAKGGSVDEVIALIERQT